MKGNLSIIRKQRRYSEEFKRQVVSDYESGRLSVPQLEKLHGINNSVIYAWIYKYSTFNKKGYRVVEHNQSSQQKLKELEKKVKDLEAALGRKQIMVDYLEEMIQVAKDELDIDIKKNYSTLQSRSSAKKK
ncbi:transposase [Saccharicrinis sp. FJH2]|uniref:transposase n=1 Tax=Saccharicrinis sp. FJH65 TaxID=3344659 RepID=UPI0035F4C774